MKKKLRWIVSIVGTVMFMLVGMSMAQAQGRIDITKATVDKTTKKVMIEGTNQNGAGKYVTIKVVDPKGEIDYVDQTTSTGEGKFSFAFTLAGSAKGTYTAYFGVEDIDVPQTVTFDYKDETTGGGTGGGGSPGTGGTSNSTAPANPVVFQLLPDGSVKAVIKAELEKDSSTAAAVVTDTDVKGALSKAIASKEGIKRIIFELTNNQNPHKYAIGLPTTVLSGDANILVEVRTAKGTVSLPGNMLKPEDAGKGQIRFVIGDAALDPVKGETKNSVGGRPVIELYLEKDGKRMTQDLKFAPILVKIPYVLSTKELTEEIKVLSLNTQGDAVTLPQTTYDKTEGMVQFKTDHMGRYTVAYVKKTFEDIGKYPWAQRAIETLSTKGIIQGTSATNYSPANKVTRADYILMLIRALQLNAQVEDQFADVRKGDYYYEAVGIAKKLGIVKGVEGNTFQPKAEITRQEMMVMAARALKAAGIMDVEGTSADLTRYKDAGKVSNYAVESVAGLSSKGIVQGDGNYIQPLANATRAETATFMYRILNAVEASAQ
ncbi:S-layer homology domain-containing protein [Paenibacillus sp. KQZ6P-2]|uniref:S-layer homology domain-containing protein n=1 Tax=Paenibacillus mangrovi TaxID=2931978 RepID=A0A9X2B4N8_9BACL|nr:S-layer homology domain-containing protein [Paenibacillus mangrovi]MCJ8014731.1 S-layer homology domain-containing protein [Paenibacillus mangrovi]